MPQLNKGDTFADGQQVTGTRLNQLVDSATLVPGAITEQGAVTANDIQTADQLLIYDNSAAALRKATVGDVFGASIPLNAETITANTLTARANQDIVLTPNDNTLVAGRSYTNSVASEVTSVTVSHTAHGLSVGSYVLVSSATNTSLNGLYAVTATPSLDTFTYQVFGSTTAGSGTLSYLKDGAVRAGGSVNVTGAINSTANLVVGGNAHFGGTGALRLPAGTTGQRPAATSTGMIRYNSTTNQAEIYNGTSWEEVGGGPFDATGGDIIIAPDATVISSGVTFACADGLNVIVTHTGHTVVIGQAVELTTAVSGYSGEWDCVSVSGTTFTLLLSSVQLPVGATTALYRKAGNFKCHIYTSTGSTTFVAGNKTGYVEVIVVGGGGGGHTQSTGGSAGGAGGVAFYNRYKVNSGQTITLSVGAGGAGGTSNGTASNGSASTFGTIIAYGGGGGQNSNNLGGAYGGNNIDEGQILPVNNSLNASQGAGSLSKTTTSYTPTGNTYFVGKRRFAIGWGGISSNAALAPQFLESRPSEISTYTPIPNTGKGGDSAGSITLANAAGSSGIVIVRYPYWI